MPLPLVECNDDDTPHASNERQRLALSQDRCGLCRAIVPQALNLREAFFARVYDTSVRSKKMTKYGSSNRHRRRRGEGQVLASLQRVLPKLYGLTYVCTDCVAGNQYSEENVMHLIGEKCKYVNLTHRNVWLLLH